MSVKAIHMLNDHEKKALRECHESWPLRILPDVVTPYAELIRIQKPAGIMMFYFPCLYGTLLFSCLDNNIGLSSITVANAKLFLLSFLLRGILCSWNDIIDQDIDRQVARTRIRPLARRAISTSQAAVWTLAQMVLLYGAFTSLPRGCFTYARPFLVLHVLYPFTKRVMHHPQLVLGFAHCLGIFISLPTLGQSMRIREFQAHTASAFCLSAAIIFWTLLNDTIYAAQDVEDDLKAGVGSTTAYWGDLTRTFLRILGVLQLLSLAAVSLILKNSTSSNAIIYSTLTCGGTGLAYTLWWKEWI